MPKLTHLNNALFQPPCAHKISIPVLQNSLARFSFRRPSLQLSSVSHRELVPFEDALSSSARQAHYRAAGGEITQLPSGKSQEKKQRALFT